MRHTRLLVVAPAAAALVFGGLSPASAHDDGHHDRTRAQINWIDDDAEVRRDGGIDVKAGYQCWGDPKDITTTVVLDQHKARYGAQFDGWLYCDGKERVQEVTLYRWSDRKVDDGGAWLYWKYSDDHRKLDDAARGVWVSGADDGHRRGHDGHDGRHDRHDARHGHG